MSFVRFHSVCNFCYSLYVGVREKEKKRRGEISLLCSLSLLPPLVAPVTVMCASDMT